jgi:hypothetical protein
MAGVHGIGGIPEPAPERTVTARDRQREDAPGAQAQDEVLITSEAQAAARLQKLVQTATQNADDVRANRVAEARAALDQENYKRPEVVQEVAKRISKLLG